MMNIKILNTINIRWALMTLLVLFNPGKSIIQDQIFNYCNQSCDFQTSWYSTKTEPQNAPSQYFLCGYAFRTMKWEKIIRNCNCQQTPNQGIKCEECKNTFYTMTNSFKGIFCHYNDWGRQIERQYQTQNKQSGSYRQTKCPRGTYIDKVSVRLSTQQQDVYVGLNGLQIRCQSMNFNQSSTIQDNGATFLFGPSDNKQGNFISAFKINYRPDFQLTGITFSFEGIAIVSKVDIKYGRFETINPITVTIQTAEVSNSAKQTVQKTVNLTKPFIGKNTWTINDGYLNNYLIDSSVKTSLPCFYQTSSNLSIYMGKSVPIIFGKQQQTSYQNLQMQTNLNIPQCKSVQVTSSIQIQSTNAQYEASIVLVNKFTKQEIYTTNSNGIWSGFLASEVKVKTLDKPLQNCTLIGMELTIDELINSTWKFYNINGYLWSFKFKSNGVFQGDKTSPAWFNTDIKWSYDGQLLSWVFKSNNSMFTLFYNALRDNFGMWHLQGQYVPDRINQHLIVQVKS